MACSTIKSRPISLKADLGGFHLLSGTIPGIHLTPPEGIQYTTSSDPLILMIKNGHSKANISFLSHTYSIKVNIS
jgi:hypothetical protein